MLARQGVWAPEPSTVLQQLKSFWKLPSSTVAFGCSVGTSVSWNGAQKRVSSHVQIKLFPCAVPCNAETPAWVLKVAKCEKLQCIYLAQGIFSFSGLLLRPELVSLWDAPSKPKSPHGSNRQVSVPRSVLQSSCAVAVSAELLGWTQPHTPTVMIFPILAHLHMQGYLWLVRLCSD